MEYRPLNILANMQLATATRMHPHAFVRNTSSIQTVLYPDSVAVTI